SPAAEPGHQHADALSIIFVILAEQADEVALLMDDRDPHIGRHAERQEQVAVAHLRSGPEGEEEARVERMADLLIEERLAEYRRSGLAAPRVEPGLLKPEQFEMVDQEGAQEHDPPAEREQPPEDPGRRAAHRPESPLDRPPEEEEKDQGSARGEHIEAALGGVRNDPLPRPLEP